MDTEEELTPNGNDATERCPICERFNNPGAVDSCEHYCGSTWDGEIIWFDKYDRFSDEFARFVEIRDEIERVFRDVGQVFIERVLLEEAILNRLTKVGSWWEDTPATVLESILEFQYGSMVETDGMLSGAGRSLYLVNPKMIDRVSDSFALVTKKLIERFRRESDTNS